MVFIRNEYKIIDNYVIIYLKKMNGEVLETYVDIDDLDRLLKFNVSWHSRKNKNTENIYAKCSEYLGYINGKPKYKTQYLHTFIGNPTNEKVVIDHINHDTLDNRKDNLRKTAVDKNAMNRKRKNINNSSGYRNVSWIEAEQKYIVQLQINGKNTRLGKFDNVHEAGEHAEMMRQKYYGEFQGEN